MIGRASLRAAVAFGLALASAASAKPSQTVVNAVRDRAVQAGFDGSILVGDANGSYALVTTGDAPVATDAVWRWASITKQLAATLAMQEVAAGRLDLDAPVSRYWPDWKAANASSIKIR